MKNLRTALLVSLLFLSRDCFAEDNSKFISEETKKILLSPPIPFPTIKIWR